ncbi:MAG TPA: hypothetical protein VHE36_07115 [Sphingomicrobium sp.]|jgi:hypothetical protein|nr:hypothetical protein [Sphingomicrobium sp.]
MRKFLIPILAAASALAVAAPASAQWAPPTYRYQSYNYGHGYNGFNFARAMQARVERLRVDIREMQARRILSWKEARSLENEAGSIQRRIYRASRNGIQPGEARNVENRIQRLEYRISREASDWNGRPGRYGRYY